MGKFSAGQFERTSEISGNIAVAWFSAGVISPVIVRPQNISEFLLSFGVSLFMAGWFLKLSLDLAKEAEK